MKKPGARKYLSKILTLFLLLFLSHFSAYAQFDEEIKRPPKFNAVYAELGGNGLLVSVQYERRLFSKIDLHARIGAGIYGEDKNLTVPVGLDYNLCLDKLHQFVDFGFGITCTKAVVDLYATVERKEPNYKPKDYFLIPIPSVQYKYAGKRGFLFKGGLFFPIRDFGVLPYIGLSFGKCF